MLVNAQAVLYILLFRTSRHFRRHFETRKEEIDLNTALRIADVLILQIHSAWLVLFYNSVKIEAFRHGVVSMNNEICLCALVCVSYMHRLTGHTNLKSYVENNFCYCKLTQIKIIDICSLDFDFKPAGFR